MINRHTKWLVSIIAIVCLLVSAQPVNAKNLIAAAFVDTSTEVKPDYSVPYQYVEEKDGYLWKPDVQDGWLPSYDGETPNGSPWIPLGLWGSISGKTSLQILEELANLQGFNNDAPLVVELPWDSIELNNSDYMWSVYDTFLHELKKQGRKAFVILKIDSLPVWISDENKSLCAARAEIDPVTGMLIQGEPRQSNYLSYTDEGSRALLEDYLVELISRYAIGGMRQSLAPVIAGWIVDVGNGYIDNEYNTYLGYEDSSKEAFREWLRIKYENNIDLLKEKWNKDNESTPGYLPNYPYADFLQVDMPVPFVYDADVAKFVARDKASWFDLTQWRKQNLAEFVIDIIKKIYEADNIYTREGDKRHLISILTLGENEGDSDWQYSCIDIHKMVQLCNDNKIPLDFCSVACTASTSENDEAVSTQWQLVRTRALTDLPVMIIKLGVKSTPDASTETKGRILKANLWELMYGGAIGVQVSDGEDTVDTEGLSYNVVKNIYATMNSLQMGITNEQGELVAEMDFNEYLLSSQPASPEVGFLQTEEGDTIFNRAEAEIYSLYGPLKRLGFQSGFVTDEEFITGDYGAKNYKALILPRNQKMSEDVFNELGNVVGRGIKLHANADVPGLLDEYGNPRHAPQPEELAMSLWDDWRYAIEGIFGIDANNTGIDTNLEDNVYVDGYESPSSEVKFLSKGLECPALEYNASPDMWKYRDELSVTFGDVLATFSNGSPAIVIKNNEAAISLFSLGDSRSSAQGQWGWQERYKFMELIYKDIEAGFGLRPLVNVSGSPYVSVDYRTGPEDSILVYVHNYNKDASQTVELESELFENKKVESLISGQKISECLQEGKVELQGLSAGGEEILLVTHTLPPNIPPVASFTASATSVYTNDSITFDASASSDDDGVIQSYAWDFGDGTNGSGAVVTHKYSSAGYYKVTLTVTDDDGAISTSTPVITITVAEFQNNAPVSSFTVSKISPSIGEEIIFNASGSYDDGNIVSYIWNFGDGASANGVIVTHKYDNPGSYIVKLTVTDNYGASSSASPITVLVLESPNQAPIASFTVSKTSPSIGEEVTFDASKSYDGDGTIQSYSWDFGDGTSGTGAIVTHKYDKAGSYTVELTVTDNRGGNGTTNLTITVSESKVGTVKDESITGGSSQGTGSQSQPSSLSSNLTTSTQGAQTGSNTTTQTQGAFPGSYGVVILDESSVAGTSADKGSKSSASSSSSATSAKSSANESYKRTTVGNSSGGIGGKERTGGIFRSESREMPPLVEPSLIEELPQQYSYTENEPLLGTQGPSITRTGVDSVIQGFRPKNIITTTISEPVTKPADVSFNENIFLRLIINSMQQFINFLNKLGSRGVKLFSRKSIWRNTDKFTA